MKTNLKDNKLARKARERDRDLKILAWWYHPEFISKNSHKKSNKRK